MISDDDGYRDLVITDLADENAHLAERVCALAANVGMYRELSVAAFDALRDMTLQHRWRQQELESERIENARLREAIVLAGMTT